MGDAGGILAYVRLTAPQAKFLEFIADRMGEIAWRWGECRPDVVQMARDLVDKGLLSDLPADQKIRLTDQGRSAVAQIRQAVERARIVTA